MPATKSAFARYRIIDDILSNRQLGFEAKSKDAIIRRIEEKLDISLSESMFHKDLRDMRDELDAPIAFDRKLNCYRYAEDGFSIRGLGLTSAEKEALDYSTAVFEQMKGTKMFSHFESAINKVIKGYRLSEYLGKSEKQILQVEEPSPGVGEQWVDVILENIVQGQRALSILYEPYGRPAKLHDFSPYLVKEYRNRWYTVGHSSRSKTVLVLALDRIKTIGPAKTRFISDSDFKPEEYFKYSMGITQIHDARPETVRLSFTPLQTPYILSQPWHHSQKLVKKTDAETIIELEVYLTHELLMAILGCGAEVKVLKPGKLVELVRETIERMGRVY